MSPTTSPATSPPSSYRDLEKVCARERIDNLLRHREVCAKLCGTMFRSADTEGRGALGWEQAKKLGAELCSRLGTPGIAEPQFKAVFGACDEDEDGLLGKEEFAMLFEVYLRLSLGIMEERDRRRSSACSSGQASGAASPITGSPILQPMEPAEQRYGSDSIPQPQEGKSQTSAVPRVLPPRAVSLSSSSPPRDGKEEIEADAVLDDISTQPPLTDRSATGTPRAGRSIPSESDPLETSEMPSKTPKPTPIAPPLTDDSLEPALVLVPGMMAGLMFLLML